MNFLDYSYYALFLISFTSFFIFILKRWWVKILFLGIQYLGVFILVSLSWPLEMAAVKLVTGWISAAILGMGQIDIFNQRDQTDSPFFVNLFMKFILVLIMDVSILIIAPKIASWMLNTSYIQILGSFILMGIGALYLGMTQHPLNITLGALTCLSGFEIIYASVETSTIVAGFLGLLSLGLALLGTFFSAPLQNEVKG